MNLKERVSHSRSVNFEIIKALKHFTNLAMERFIVSHPSAYKNSVRGQAIYYLYLEVKGLFLQV